jgi:very-short-patch-repair endonuclease
MRIISWKDPLLSGKKTEFRKKTHKLKANKNKKKEQVFLSLNKRAELLNKKLPKSEIWFWRLYKKHKMNNSFDLKNTPWEWFIPDIVNHNQKYVIEIDGESHNSKEQKYKDKNKDKFYLSKGYAVFRIKAFCENSYFENMRNLKQHRKQFEEEIKPTTILRKKMIR